MREANPDIALSVDANAAYGLEDVDVFRALDAFDLLMIEQPLHHDDLVRHADLQAQIDDGRVPGRIDPIGGTCCRMRCGSVRVASSTSSRAASAACRRPVGCTTSPSRADVPVWCGGMLETGVGRALNLALAAMPGFTLPGDTSASARYFPEDLTEPFVMDPDGTMAVPTGPGIGVTPLPERLEACTAAGRDAASVEPSRLLRNASAWG